MIVLSINNLLQGTCHCEDKLLFNRPCWPSGNRTNRNPVLKTWREMENYVKLNENFYIQ